MQRILIIDDEEHLPGIMGEVLEFEGYTVDIAGDVAQGIAKAKATPPDLILCDWQLPDGTGGDVLAHLPGMKMIVVTGNYPKKHEVSEKNFLGHFIKPFPMEKLLLTIQAALQPKVVAVV